MANIINCLQANVSEGALSHNKETALPAKKA